MTPFMLPTRNCAAQKDAAIIATMAIGRTRRRQRPSTRMQSGKKM